MSVFLTFSESYFGGGDEVRRVFSDLNKAKEHARWLIEEHPGNGMIFIQELVLNESINAKLIYYSQDFDSDEWIRTENRL